jgi:hypothetical protein
MEEEDRNRYNILIDRGTEVFERERNNISILKDRSTTFIGIILTTLSISLPLVLFLLQIGLQFSNLDYILLFFFCFFSVISLVISYSLIIPTKSKDLEIFEQKRFDELTTMSEQTLLSDFLSHLKKSYEYNVNKYNYLIRWFKVALCSSFIATITFISFVIKNLIWG